MGYIKSVDINGRVFRVSELTMQDIHDLSVLDQSPASFADVVASMLEACTDAKREDIMPYHPSDLKPLVDALVEVNKSFFEQAAATKLEGAAAWLEQRIKGIFMLAYSPSSKMGT